MQLFSELRIFIVYHIFISIFILISRKNDWKLNLSFMCYEKL